ncbi:MAG: TRAP transporter substrate-binding protein DctP [Treponema socranskii subsp. buccale]
MKKMIMLIVAMSAVMYTVFALGGNDGTVRTVSLRASTADSENSTFYAGMIAFKNAVEEKSNGSIKVTVYPNGQLGNLREAVEGLQMGTIDITAANSSVIANFCPNVSVFDLPFLFDSDAHVYKASDGKVGESLNTELAKQKLVVLGWWPIGFRNITLGRPISDISQLKGKRIRIMESKVFQDIFRALGVDPVPLNFSELYSALQQGTVDGQENPYATIFDARIYEVNKYVIETGHVYTPAAFMISQNTWNKFSPEQQNIVKEAGKIATDACRKAYEQKTEESKREMVNKHGVKIITTFDKSKMRDMTKGVYKDYPQLNSLVRDVEALR